MPVIRTLTQSELEGRYEAALRESGRRNIACGGDLYLRVEGSAERRAAWYRRTGVETGRRFVRLGDYPALNMEQARRLLAEQARSVPSETEDRPDTVRSVSRKAGVQKPCFGVYAERFLSTKNHRHRYTTIKRAVEGFASFYKRPVDAISTAEFRDCIEAADSDFIALEMRRCLVRIMDLAVEDEIIEYNKFRIPGTSGLLGRGYTRGEGYKSVPVSEFGKLFADLMLLKVHKRNFFLLLALSCLRPGECLQLRQSWLDEKRQVLSLPRSQARVRFGEIFTIPVSWQMLAVMNFLHSLNPEYDLLFPSPNDPQRVTHLSPITHEFGLVTGGRIHADGFRKAARAWFAQQGVSIEVGEKCLDHPIRRGDYEAYRKSELLEERRPVMQAWADVVCAALPQGWRAEVLGTTARRRK